jgi:sugar phosphate isomerase/epimerase
MFLNRSHIISVFTKPWMKLSIDELIALICRLGFDAIEFPLRKGFQVEPEQAMTGLPHLAEKMAARGLRITSVAGDTREATFAACQAAGVPLIRIMLQRSPEEPYMACEARWKHELAELVPLCRRYGVKIGIQQHFGAGVFSSMELRHVLEGLDTSWIGAIWDAAHSALAGECPEQALDILWDYLFLANFKNAYYQHVTQPSPDGSDRMVFKPYFTTAREGMADWPRALALLLERGYTGVLCMPAEYTEAERVNDYIGQDLTALRTMLAAVRNPV